MAAHSLGKIPVPVPGTIVRATVNQASSQTALSCNAVLFEALPGNTGKVYIGDNTLNKATLSGCFAILPIPTVNMIPSFSAGNPSAIAAFNAADFYVDADIATDGVLGSIVR